MKDIMVDLETLGNSSRAAIIAIGAVEFDRTGTGQTFYTLVEPQSCVDAGLTMDASTIMWWMQQSDEARAAFKAVSPPKLRAALTDLSTFFHVCGAERVWGNGATFDNVILSSAYDAACLPRPWKFWNDRCYRTLKNLHPDVAFVKPTVAHNALDDAFAQAKHAVQIFNKPGVTYA